MSGKWVPVLYEVPQMKPMAASPARTISCSAQVGVDPTILSREADLGRFLQGGLCHDPANVRRITQSGWATLTRSQVAFWSSPGDLPPGAAP